MLRQTRREAKREEQGARSQTTFVPAHILWARGHWARRTYRNWKKMHTNQSSITALHDELALEEGVGARRMSNAANKYEPVANGAHPLIQIT